MTKEVAPGDTGEMSTGRLNDEVSPGTGHLNDEVSDGTGRATDEVSMESKRREVAWPNVLFFIHVQLLGLYGAYLLLTEARLPTMLLLLVLYMAGVTGVCCGAHRLWAHRTFCAGTITRALLMLCQTLAGVGPVLAWARLHRLHHWAREHHDLAADPYPHHNGFLHAHVFARLHSLSPYQQRRLAEIDVSDLESDPVLTFQQRFYYWLLYPLLMVILPVNAPLEYFGESMLVSFFVLGFLRYWMVLHATWLVESGATIWGLGPKDKYPADTNMVFVLTKSYWPHYHYLLPTDYKTGEFGTYDSGWCTGLIKVALALGWAWGERSPPSGDVQRALAAVCRAQGDKASSAQDKSALSTNAQGANIASALQAALAAPVAPSTLS